MTLAGVFEDILFSGNANVKSEQEDEELESELSSRYVIVCVLTRELTICTLIRELRWGSCSVIGGDAEEVKGSAVLDRVCPMLGVSSGNEGDGKFSSLVRVSAIVSGCLHVVSRMGNRYDQRSE